MNRRHPDPDQTLFRWMRNDLADERPSRPEDAAPVDVPPPLRERILARYGPPAPREARAGGCGAYGKPPARPVARPMRLGST